MVTQSDETEPKRASSLALGIAVPVKVVVVDYRPVEGWTIGDRDYNDGSRLDQCPGHDCGARENPAEAGFRRAPADGRQHPRGPPCSPRHRAVALAPAASSRPRPLLSYPP